ncbi:hypothetical protein FF011L_44940 [Roseimaritima multifibrata]|uniref:Zinc-finger domain-containing protein n=1 Tax=Roseimaritima multifibrata TaxID=1930274 RepID=A0A517MLD1_9BACT|nr:hypothetical protein [Roseimaritima multifibrata]QDS95694.1 hypothetical protein FF011L_44940 [Roseimaritima multifibrata]
MALPPENIEQLLEEYLDDALRGDERQAVEDALANDSALAERLDDLLAERALRLQAMLGDSRFENVRLDAGFADRVLAAVDQAEGVAPTVPLKPADNKKNWKPVVIAVAALAACLMLAYLGLMPGGDSGVDGPEVAGSNRVVPAVPSGDLANAPAVELPQANPSMAVAASESAQEVPATDLVPPPAAMGDVPTPEMVAADRSAAEFSPSLQVPADDLKMVMVYEVSQTELGKANGAVVAALKEAGIDLKARQPVADEVVSYLQEANLVAAEAEAGANGSILYVEASGKSLDRFMVSMFADSDNIAGLRWSLAFDPPVVAAVKELEKIDPAKVQHEGGASTAWQLTRQGAGAENFEFPDGPSRLQPLQRDSWKAVGSAPLGPDIQSQVLLLIR